MAALRPMNDWLSTAKAALWTSSPQGTLMQKRLKKPSKPSRIISLVSSAAAPHPCHSIYGVNFSHKSNGNFFSFINPKITQTYLRMHMSTNTTTTTDTHLSPLAWKHWSMINPTNATHTLNTAQKLLPWAHQPNTINDWNFGPQQHAPHVSQGQLFSSTNI